MKTHGSEQSTQTDYDTSTSSNHYAQESAPRIGAKEEAPFNPDSITDILNAYLEATGLSELSSYTMRGTPWEDNGLKRSASIKALYPNYYKFKLEYVQNQYSIEFGYDGEQTWLVKSLPGDVQFPNQATDNKIILMLSSLAHLAWSFQSEKAEIEGIKSVLELMPPKERDGRLCYVIRSKNLLPFEMEHYIDSETFQEAFRSASFARADGSTLMAGVEYNKSSISEEFHLPTKINYYENGTLVDQIDYKSAQTNPTVMKLIFKQPSTE